MGLDEGGGEGRSGSRGRGVMVVGEVADAALDVDAGVCSRTAAAFSSHSM